MAQEPDSDDPNAGTPPGFVDGLFGWYEQLVTALGLGSPRRIFRIRRARAEYQERRAAQANIGRSVSYTHKTCPACGRLVERGSARCSYCQASVRWAPGPGVMRTLGLSMPHGSVAMTLIGVNVLAYIVTSIGTLRVAEGDSFGLLLASLFRPDMHLLYHMGGLHPYSVLAGEYWRLSTYQFLHGGAVHIFFNMFALFSLGPTTEDVYGPWKTAVIYWTTGVAAGITSLATTLFMYGPGYNGLTVGASGAIFGMIGVLIGHATRGGRSKTSHMREFLVRWAVYGLVMGFMLGADNAAHVGGLASGYLLGVIVPDGAPRLGLSTWAWRLAALAVGAAIAGGFIMAAMVPR